MPKIERSIFGTIKNTTVERFQLENDQGMSISVMTYGATLLEVVVPDKTGRFENVVLGCATLAEYSAHSPYFGATIGRVGGRIRQGKWLNTQLTQNEGEQHIHGGVNAVSHRVWEVLKSDVENLSVTLGVVSPAGDNGYPGNLEMTVTYQLYADNHFEIITTGITDEATLFNPTNHSYFNLSGDLKETISEHQLEIGASQVALMDDSKCPTGVLAPVANTAFDFQAGQTLKAFTKKEPQGLDTPFPLNEGSDFAVRLTDNVSGRRMVIETDANAIVVFSTTGMNEPYLVNGTRPMVSELGIALEPQQLPDAIHHDHFGDIVLPAGRHKSYRSSYRFDTIKQN